MREIDVSGGSIRLGQLLKLADVVEAGSQAKDLLAGGRVLVNGEVETRRGRRLTVGDQVVVDDGELLVVRESTARRR